MSTALYIPQIGHSPSAVCDGSLEHVGNGMYECGCGSVLTSAFNRPRSVNSVISEITAVNRLMNDKSKSLEQTHREAKRIMGGR
nr:hypothetical protein MarFTME_448 [Marseillevirus futianmevirus]